MLGKYLSLKDIVGKFSHLLVITILITSFLPLNFIHAQDRTPVSTPVELATDASTALGREKVFQDLKTKYSQYGEDRVNAAETKVREDLNKPIKNDFYLVKFKPEQVANADTLANQVAGADVVPSRLTRGFGTDTRLIKIANDKSKLDQMVQFNLDDSVESVESNQVINSATWTTDSSTAKPDDFNASEHWYHIKTKLPEDYKALGCPSATLCGGSSSVLVAVIDTGVAFEDYNATYKENLGGGTSTNHSEAFHVAPELSGISIWSNPSEDNSGGDNDGNGICDDLHGVDYIAYLDNLALISTDAEWTALCNSSTPYVQKEGHPNDDEGHGTFVTGMINSLTDNGTGSFGAAFKTTIMPIKALDYTGSGSTFGLALAIRYAVDHGARVINMSIAGLTSPSGTIENAIDYANQNLVLVIAASGNKGLSSVEYPAAYSASYPNVVSVGASTNTDTKAYYTSYGSALDMTAPVGEGSAAGNAAFGQSFADADTWTGVGLDSRDFSTFGNKHWIGTSFAAPQVTAAAALLISQNISYTPSTVKNLLKVTATDIDAAGRDDQTGNGNLNVYAVQNAAWSSWQLDFGQTPTNINSVVFGGKIYQAVSTITRNIYMRNSTDGTTWSNWQLQAGQTPGEVNMVVFDGKIYQAIRNINRNIFMRNSSDGVNWTSWQMDVGMTPDDINMAVFNTTLYQVIRNAGNNVYMRSTDDGTTWTSWTPQGPELVEGQITMISFNSNLLQIYHDSNRNIYMRSTADGSTWSSWQITSGMSPENVNMEVFNGTLYQVTRNVSRYIYVRTSTDGSTWNPWILTTGQTPGEINIVNFNNKLFNFTNNITRFIYARYFLGVQ